MRPFYTNLDEVLGETEKDGTANRKRRGKRKQKRDYSSSLSQFHTTTGASTTCREDPTSVADEGCNKYFNTFNRLSGGVMLLWCKHRVCVGFHIIPKSEGRNDVFSAIVTR